MRFIGIDLAWSLRKTHLPDTGVVVLDEAGAVIASDHLTTDAAILAFVLTHRGQDGCLIGIDAPLVVPNDTGRRPCEAQLQAVGIPSYPANRQLFEQSFGGARGEGLSSLLAQHGFTLATSISQERPTWALFEVYPRSFIRRTWDAIPPYKGTGQATSLLHGLRTLQQLLLADLDPPVSWDEPPVPIQGGTTLAPMALKRQGDLLDAALSAYVPYLAWCRGPEIVEVFGDVERGFIVAPRSGWHIPTTAPAQWPAVLVPPDSYKVTLSPRVARPQELTRQESRRTPRLCLCGCGGMTRGGRFLPGHDAKLKGRLLRRLADGDEAAMDELTALGWGHFALKVPGYRPG